MRPVVIRVRIADPAIRAVTRCFRLTDSASRWMPADGAYLPGIVGVALALPIQHRAQVLRSLGVLEPHRMPVSAIRAVEFVAGLERKAHSRSANQGWCQSDHERDVR